MASDDDKEITVANGDELHTEDFSSSQLSSLRQVQFLRCGITHKFKTLATLNQLNLVDMTNLPEGHCCRWH